jgi:hypothetical protein
MGMRWTPAQLTDLESFLEWIQGPSDLPHEPLQRHPTSKVRGPSVGKLPMVVVTNKARRVFRKLLLAPGMDPAPTQESSILGFNFR